MYVPNLSAFDLRMRITERNTIYKIAIENLSMQMRQTVFFHHSMEKCFHHSSFFSCTRDSIGNLVATPFQRTFLVCVWTAGREMREISLSFFSSTQCASPKTHGTCCLCHDSCGVRQCARYSLARSKTSIRILYNLALFVVRLLFC